MIDQPEVKLIEERIGKDVELDELKVNGLSLLRESTLARYSLHLNS